ncbi:unnamed protein product [Choristocarpus tenellus]
MALPWEGCTGMEFRNDSESRSVVVSITKKCWQMIDYEIHACDNVCFWPLGISKDFPHTKCKIHNHALMPLNGSVCPSGTAVSQCLEKLETENLSSIICGPTLRY